MRDPPGVSLYAVVGHLVRGGIRLQVLQRCQGVNIHWRSFHLISDEELLLFSSRLEKLASKVCQGVVHISVWTETTERQWQKIDKCQ